MPSFSASSSIADSRAKAPWEWPGARSGAPGPVFVKTVYSWTSRFGLFCVERVDRSGGARPPGDPGRPVGDVVDAGEGAVLLRPDLDRDLGARGVAGAQVLLAGGRA